MKTIATLLLSMGVFCATAQTTITNGGFENWGNTVPAGDTHEEPTNWYSNQSGSSTASLGGQTCFKDATTMHSGLYSVRVETISGPLSTTINGNVTTGVVNAPTFTKSDGYIGTINYSTSSDVRRMSFTGRPDSLVGWYKYTPGAATEQGKVRVILHTNNYFDPETPTTYHAACVSDKIADVTFLTPMSAVTTWTRFSVPFNYTSASSPTYIMVNVTSSANQNTTVNGSKLWLDDIEAVYAAAPGTCGTPVGFAAGSITATSATLSWSEPSGSVGSQYVVSTTSGTPTGSGTATTALTHNLTGLLPATTYYAYLRDSCSATSLSSWVSTTFTTPHAVGVDMTTAAGFGLRAYPNPAGDELSVQVSGFKGCTAQLQLMDISGRLLKATTITSGDVKMNLAGLPSGFYLLHYTDAEHSEVIRVTKK